MASSGKTFIVEHLDPELGPWSELEYLAIASETQATGGSFILSSLPPTFQVPADLESIPAFKAENRGVEELYAGQKARVCLLDPSAAKDLSPEDGETFDAFLFGGILGDDPPRDRTSELRKKGFEGRRLGPKQMTTDTAVRVTRIVVQDKVALDKVPYVDFPELKFSKHESTEMPFRYVTNEDGKPIMPKGMVELIQKDADKAAEALPVHPLRILFCGSDEFSCASLRAVYEEHSRNRGLIESLDVMVLPPKRMGRGYKEIREVPCKVLAEKLGLTTHQRETFTKWELPEATNLVIAVSFGLFVPPRILRSAKYGGLNVHPSLLPDLRGPAPIHHAILQGRKYTGVSLQTLDDKAFDHGTVLAQTPYPGIPIPPGATVQELTTQLAPIGAQMLVQGLRDGVYIPSRQSGGWKAEELEGKDLVHAPKVNKADGQVDWTQWTAEDFARRTRVLGSVWTRAVNKKGEVKRLILQDIETASVDGSMEIGALLSFAETPGIDSDDARHQRPVTDLGDGSCLVQLVNGEWIRVKRVKEEGKPERDAAVVLRSYGSQ
ncbi:hypothetical protein AK830_g10275 [Neonectria ditissima]|uniref:methionyl-tRNA formyltransferase n=1 Tax=Neonectria ditissima TaxID=78410 RepID=A0A0P7B7C8_9HYPO|nr:hypothetical protein AK830_g10275 [Neonectria ditissima]